MDFLDFLDRQNKLEKHSNSLNESFKITEIDNVHKLLLSLFRKKISKKVCGWDWQDNIIDDKKMRSYYFINLKDGDAPLVWSLNYLMESESAEVYSISFFDVASSLEFLWSDKTKITANLIINTLGTSVAYFVPIICHIVNNKDFNISKNDAIELGTEIFNEGKQTESWVYKYGNARYRVFENLNNELIDDMFYLSIGYKSTQIVNERTEAMEYRWQKRKERDDAFNKMRMSKSDADKKNYERLKEEYAVVMNAVKSGAQTLDDIKMALSKNETVQRLKTERQDLNINDAQLQKGPRQAFKEMQVYVKTVIKGLQPGVIICGAPGLGKTYRVLQQLEANGFEDGKNLDIIKGKCTPRQLYLSLFKYNNKGQIILIDDADALVGPKAPEDCINMLKAALDSTSTPEGRKINYRITGNLVDDEGREVPKTCYYNGGIIVITNYSSGQLDSALRGRTFVQSLDFTNEQILELLKEMLPELGKTQLSMESKRKALNYLNELAKEGAEMEISIRTFLTCARLFAVCEDELDIYDDDVKSMIREQMENQAIRGGRKY